MNQKLACLLVCLTISAISGCGGSSGDQVTINQEITADTNTSGGGGSTGNDTNSEPEPPANCTDADISPLFVTLNDSCEGTLSGRIDQDYTLVSSVEWRLDGPVLVGAGNVEITSAAQMQEIRDAGVTLTIEPGTNIKAFDDGTLYVTRGSKIMAEGTAAAPITFSSLDSDYSGLGEWGGVIIAGFAPQYGAGNTGACFVDGEEWCNVTGEGGADVDSIFGGDVVDDNSGVLKYVRIAEGGKIAGPNNEINGLTLQGVGHGTQLSYIQVHDNLDDGIEWFGGTVDLTHAVLTGNDDDDIDFDEGYQGNIQYAIIRKSNNAAPAGSNDPRGIEANSSDDDYVPQTQAALANILILGGAVNNNADAGSQPGMRLRGALTTSIYNSAVNNFDTGCIRVDDAKLSDGSQVDSDVTLVNLLNDCRDGIYDKRDANQARNVFSEVFTLSPTMAVNESFADVGETIIEAVNTGSGFVFDQTDFIGAVDPTANSGWWEGWILEGSLDSADDSFVAADFVDYDEASNTATISGTIDQDYVLGAGVNWVLSGPVRVGRGNQEITSQSQMDDIIAEGVTLTIRPGTTVSADSAGTLLVTRGSKLHAVGTAARPITFKPLGDDLDTYGQWGGVILSGFAPQYGAGNTGQCWVDGEAWCNVQGEGGADVDSIFGGNNPADNSGSLKYVRIAGGGLVAGPNNEVNGLTLQGVGYGTRLDYIQVHANLDDGIEWFGGNVSATHLVLTGNDDDDIDFDEGAVINVQYAIIQKSNNEAPSGSNDPRGVEANSSDDEYVPQTFGVLANLYVEGGAVNNNADHSKGQQPGMRLRGALTAQVHNTYLTGWDTGCIRIDDADIDGAGTIVESDVTLQDTRGDCGEGNFYDKRTADAELGEVGDDLSATVSATYAIEGADAATLSSPIESANGADDGFEFDQTDYIGAVDPDAATGWWEGWIIEGSLR